MTFFLCNRNFNRESGRWEHRRSNWRRHHLSTPFRWLSPVWTSMWYSTETTVGSGDRAQCLYFGAPWSRALLLSKVGIDSPSRRLFRTGFVLLPDHRNDRVWSSDLPEVQVRSKDPWYHPWRPGDYCSLYLLTWGEGKEKKRGEEKREEGGKGVTGSCCDFSHSVQTTPCTGTLHWQSPSSLSCVDLLVHHTLKSWWRNS